MHSESDSAAPVQEVAPGRLSIALRIASFTAIAFAFLFHFGATLLYLTPLNPVKARFMIAVTSYMDPYFSQNWSMFAPDPILEDEKLLLVSCRVSGNDGTVNKPLVDVTSRLRESQWKYRLTPAARMIRQQLTPLSLVSPPPDVFTTHLAKLEGETDPDLAEAGKEARRTKEKTAELGTRILQRVASAECDRLSPGETTVAVRPVMLTAAAPVFSRRMTQEIGPTRKIDFGWLAAEHVERM